MNAVGMDQKLDELLAECRALARRIRDYDGAVTSIPDRVCYGRIMPAVITLEHALKRYAERKVQRGRTAPPSPVALAFTQLLGQLAEQPAVPTTPRPALPKGSGPVKPVAFPASVFTAAEVLQFLGLNQKSGILRVQAGDERFEIHLYDGDITGVSGTATPAEERLGALLVARGVLTERNLGSVVEIARREQTRIGKALVDRQFAERSDVLDALHHQASLIFRRLLAATAVTIEFEPASGTADPDGLCLCVTKALLEGLAADDRTRTTL